MAGQKSPDGSVGLGVVSDKLKVAFKLAADGSAVMEVSGLGDRLLGQYRITPEGSLIRNGPAEERGGT
jgi:hypothetical protein